MSDYTSPQCLRIKKQKKTTTRLASQPKVAPLPILEQVEPVKSHGWSFADLSIVAVVDLDSALLHLFPYFSLPPPPVYSNGVAPLTYCTAVCHHPALQHKLVPQPRVAPLPTRTSRTGEVTRMAICRFVHRCCR